MNWITKALSFGEKIKRVLKKRPSKEDIANSDWTSCCKGPILKKILKKIYGFATRVENIIELIVDKDLILFLEEMLTKYLIRQFLQKIPLDG